ncbi:MAG: Gfo/Idh/MocA family oxidoreductase, partial [Prevotellaceae bacterium]|jgi:predicted dehydrogenase|nr:Gfo/Idh/MocA family oxidoreductase [Prevotellaceae bacterium]
LRAFVERHGNNSAERYPSARIYRSCEELFEADDIDLVVVNTPSPTHFNYARKALEAGKHVVVDKPFAVTPAEARILIDIAERQNLVLTVFHNRRWEGELVAMKQAVDEKRMGKLIDGEFRFERFKNAPNPKAHKEEPRPGNGLMYELCTHLIDQAIFLFGMPKSVFAEIRREREFSEIDDYCAVTLYYENRFRLLIKSSLLVADIGPSYIINGHGGSFVKYRANVLEEQMVAGIRPGDANFGRENDSTAARLTELQPDGSLKTVSIASPVSSYTGFYRQLAEAVNSAIACKCTDAQPEPEDSRSENAAGQAGKNAGEQLCGSTYRHLLPVDPEDALNGLRIIEAAYESAAQRRIIDL